MFSSNLLPLFILSAKAANNSYVLAEIPLCSIACSGLLLDAGCDLSNMSQCLCTNNVLQKELAICLMTSCNTTELTIATTIFQDDICSDAPHQSRSAEIIRYTIIHAVITIIFVVMRIISRRLVSRSFCLDDWAVVVSAILVVPTVGIVTFNASHGFGQHFWDIPPGNIILLRQLYYASQILYVVNLASSKFSILLLYHRIFVNVRFRLFLNITICWMVFYTFAFLMAVTFQCLPVNIVWDTLASGKCVNSQALIYTGAALGILEDLIIMVLPISELRHLNLDRRKRVGLCLLFALGSFASITSMIRLKFIIHFGNSIDSTWDNVDVVIWSNIETYTALICACLICMRPLLMRVISFCFPSLITLKEKENPNRPRDSIHSRKPETQFQNGKNQTTHVSSDNDLESLVLGEPCTIIKTTSITITEDSMSFKLDDEAPYSRYKMTSRERDDRNR
ncbi:hypothetical protein G7Y89_g8141 [Cudoniella acicularis]|uniref:Extracellular membrane protein CFEM domain-containing protein n=1 Tax=Cudoniella acicularis TaxID=354080 RepID=A0A8H4W349_9HELO|nr:hypothetical protein G7Y89_g8141 [Cudoniella acicularis]